MTKIHKQIQEKVTCDICKKDITGDELEHYHIYDVLSENGQMITLSIELQRYFSGKKLDICEKCKAKAMILLIIREWGLSDLFYPLFKTKKDECGMDTFIKKLMHTFAHPDSKVDWIHANLIRNKKNQIKYSLS